MKFDVHMPCQQLLPYVKHLVISENEEANTYNIIPNTALVIGFQYRGNLSYIEAGQENKLAAAGVTGLLDTYRTFKNTAGVGSVLVVFREHGAARLLKTPLHKLFGESLSLDNFFDRQLLADLQEQLVSAKNDNERVNLVQQFLIAHLNENPPDLLVNAAIKHINVSKGTIRISELASLLNTSASPLEKRFRADVGASPKKFATIVRAQNVLAAMDKGNRAYADYLSSYYDQAHFIKDFKKFAAVTPEQYLKGLK